MPLEWSEPRPPNSECPYDHVVAPLAGRQIYIEWKGWKDYPSYEVALPEGTPAVGREHSRHSSLGEAKARAADAVTAWARGVLLEYRRVFGEAAVRALLAEKEDDAAGVTATLG